MEGEGFSNERLAHLLRKSFKNYKRGAENKKILEFVQDIQYKISEGELKDEFTEWDCEYIEVVLWLYGIGYAEFDSTDILECLGYDKDERGKFNSKLSAFRGRLRKHFEVEL